MQQSIPTLFISSTFFQFYDLKVLEGEIPEKFDGWADYKIVLNKAAMKTFGYNQLKDAFVRSETPLWVVRTQDGQMEEGGTKLMPVMAVIDNYYPGHLTEGIKPMAFIVGRAGYGDNYLISIKPGKEKEVIEYLKKIEKEIYNTDDFNYTWLTDEVHKLYAQDRQTANVYFVFALIAIIWIIPVRHPPALSRNSHPQSEWCRNERPLLAVVPQIYQSHRLCICIGCSAFLLSHLYVHTGFCAESSCRCRNLFSGSGYHFPYFIGHINLANTQSRSN